jgi:hypothetical protein
VNLKAFFVAALSSALDLGIATADDVIRHVTPDVLAVHLPRPLWARLLTACIGAPRVDAQLVVETIGVPNLCEHVPAQIIWGCIEELALRSLASGATASSAPASVSRSQTAAATPALRPVPLATPPPPLAVEPKVAGPISPMPVGPSIPAPGVAAPAPGVAAPAPGVAAADAEPEAAGRARTASSQRFRQGNTGVGRPAATASTRRPQAQTTPPASSLSMPPVEPPSDRGGGAPRAKRGQSEADFEVETVVGKDDWKNSVIVEDEYVEWSASEETVTSGDDVGRKR